MSSIRGIVRRLPSLVVLFALSIPARAPAARGHAASGVGDDIVAVAYDAAPASVDPAIAYDGAGPLVLRAAYEALVRMKGTSTTDIEGVLATSWTSDAQKVVWTF